MTRQRALYAIIPLALSLLGVGCISHAVRIEPITLEPIEMTIDVNLHSDPAGTAETAGAESPASPDEPAPPAD